MNIDPEKQTMTEQELAVYLKQGTARANRQHATTIEIKEIVLMASDTEDTPNEEPCANLGIIDTPIDIPNEVICANGEKLDVSGDGTTDSDAANDDIVTVNIDEKEKAQFKLEKFQRFIEIFNERKKLSDDLDKYVDDTAAEYDLLEKELMQMMIDNDMPQCVTDGSLVYFHPRNIISFNKMDTENPAEAQTKSDAIMSVFKAKFDEMAKDKAHEYYLELMDMPVKNLVILAMKNDPEMKDFISETYNTNTLTATLHDLKETYGDIPECVQPFFTLGEIVKLRVKSNQKSKDMKGKKSKSKKK